MDAKDIYIAGTHEVAYLISTINGFHRNIIACELSLVLNATAVKEALIKALHDR